LRLAAYNEWINKEFYQKEFVNDLKIRYEELFKNIEIGVAVFEAIDNGSDFIFKDINTAGEKIDNVKKEEVLGKSLLKMFPEVEEVGLFDVFKKVWQTGIPDNFSLYKYREERLKGWRENFVYKLKTGEIVEIYKDVTDREKSREELEKTKEQLEITLKSIGDGVLVTDVNGNLTMLNNAAEKLTGWNNEEAEGLHINNVFNIVNEYTRLQAKNPVEEVFKKGNIVGLANHTVLISKSGQEYCIADSAAPIKKADGTLEGAVMVFRDETEKRSIEKALKESEKKYRTVFENTGTAMLIIEENTGISLINNQMVKLSGYTKKETENKMSLSDFIVEKDIDTVLKNHHERRKTHNMAPRQYETALMTKTGEIRNILLTVDLMPEKKQSVASFIDITELKNTEKKLKKSEEKFRLLAENARDIIYRIKLFAEKFEFEYISPSVTEITGYTPEDYYKDSSIIYNIVHPKDKAVHENFEKNDANFFNTPLKTRWVHKNGKVRWIEQHNVPIYDDEGNLTALEGIARDVTNNEYTENKLRYLTMHDSLTDLYNRAFFEEEIARIEKANILPVGIIICDIDGLKLINDTLGHEKGDNYLKKTADIIKLDLRDYDSAARIGGDEFVIIKPYSTRKEIEIHCENIKEMVEKINSKSMDIPLSISLGHAYQKQGKLIKGRLFKEAEDNMCRNKLLNSKSIRSYMVETLTRALEARDFITEGHADRLEDLLINLAKKLKLSEDLLAKLRLLAKFHDIGKVGVPDNILFKKGPLTSDEKKEMQRHSEIGHRIAIASPDLALIADYILKHHEWWNGKGYPLGLKGKDIPLLCRILAVADAYDAMTNDRPYRKAMTHEDAVKELKDNAGVQFDPEVVWKFINIFN
jgi:diguanylate cyclase (GGDEF)-like protein/PAS domain S-box-containing protein